MAPFEKQSHNWQLFSLFDYFYFLFLFFRFYEASLLYYKTFIDVLHRTFCLSDCLSVQMVYCEKYMVKINPDLKNFSKNCRSVSTLNCRSSHSCIKINTNNMSGIKT